MLGERGPSNVMENFKGQALELDHDELVQREDPVNINSCGQSSERTHRTASCSP